MTTATLPTITHRIAYDRTTRDFACYIQIDGDPEQYIGSAASYHAGEMTCLDYRRDLLESDVFRTATELDGTCGDCGAALDAMGLCGCQESLITVISLDGHETTALHATIAERNEYLRYNPAARIVPPLSTYRTDTTCQCGTNATVIDGGRVYCKACYVGVPA